MPVYIAEEPLDCVVRGTGKTLEEIEKLKTVLINNRKGRWHTRSKVKGENYV